MTEETPEAWNYLVSKISYRT